MQNVASLTRATLVVTALALGLWGFPASKVSAASFAVTAATPTPLITAPPPNACDLPQPPPTPPPPPTPQASPTP
jgi:hypothetical protein